MRAFQSRWCRESGAGNHLGSVLESGDACEVKRAVFRRVDKVMLERRQSSLCLRVNTETRSHLCSAKLFHRARNGHPRPPACSPLSFLPLTRRKLLCAQHHQQHTSLDTPTAASPLSSSTAKHLPLQHNLLSTRTSASLHAHAPASRRLSSRTQQL